MADEKNRKKDLSIEEIHADDLEDVSGGTCGSCGTCSTPPAPAEPVKPPLNQNQV